ncbi:MAG: hypothetical protein II797_01970, partial [Clostridia bacterium]|nr:hypothetical protein [Clostridia bacterium]
MYMYQMIITFDMSLPKLIKNALIFVFLGIKRNIMVVLATFLLVGLEALLMASQYTFAIAVILPLVYLFGLVGLMSVYAAYPKIKEVMIDPYYKEHPQEKPVTRTSETGSEEI